MRSLSLCVIWLVFTLLALVVAIFPPPSPATIVLGLAALYGAQAFIAEALGVQIDQTSISFPRRPLANFPLRVFARANPLHRHRPNNLEVHEANPLT